MKSSYASDDDLALDDLVYILSHTDNHKVLPVEYRAHRLCYGLGLDDVDPFDVGYDESDGNDMTAMKVTGIYIYDGYD